MPWYWTLIEVVFIVVYVFLALVGLGLLSVMVFAVVWDIAERRFLRKGCPKCGARKLRRRYLVDELIRANDMISRGIRSRRLPKPWFYLCGNCGARLKRWAGKYEWEDASSPDYDEYYNPETSVDNSRKLPKR